MRHWGTCETVRSWLIIIRLKMFLDDHVLALFQSNLFPASLTCFGTEEPIGLYMEPGLLEHTLPMLMCWWPDVCSRPPGPDHFYQSLT
ncbi:rCG28627, partial [Rattus norvegicus]